MPATKLFHTLGLPPALLSRLAELGYETPTPIQEQSIPILIEGTDLLAQAQTGTGKTAAFALPILSTLKLSLNAPQALIVAPTRELAIQVAEAFQSYAKDLKGFHVTPIYGGQDYKTQLKSLKRGTQVVVGTPGRIMDHLRRGSLLLDSIKTIVLDEADEMLKMGFIEDVEWILEQVPHTHQTALFSATIPPSISQIAKRYLTNAKKIQIKTKQTTVSTIEQFYTRVSSNKQKLDVLTRFLEVEELQATIIFARTKNGSAELAEKLQARGYAAAPLNGDMNQSLRKSVINRIKNGALDIIVATDVAARGIDVDRISHVINYDIPYDSECYIHRIGRTGRAGRQGKALLFVTPREHRLLKDIERTIHQSIQEIEPPSIVEMKAKRNKQLTEKVIALLEKGKKLTRYHEMVNNIMEQGDFDPKDIAAALAYLEQQTKATALPTHELSQPEPERERRHKQSWVPRRKPSGPSHNKKTRTSKTFSAFSEKRKPRKAKPVGERARRK